MKNFENSHKSIGYKDIQDNLKNSEIKNIKKQSLSQAISKINIQSIAKSMIEQNLDLSNNEYLKQFRKNIKNLISDINCYDYLHVINQTVQKQIKECIKSKQIINIQIIIKQMYMEMQGKYFRWELHYQNLNDLKHYLYLFNDLCNNQINFIFIDMNEIRKMYEIEKLIKFFEFPYYNHQNREMYDKINAIHVGILHVLKNYFFMPVMRHLPQINAKEIWNIDPFMRYEIRKKNRIIFKSDFWKIKDFEFYSFILRLIDKFILTIVPNVNLKFSDPLINPLLQLIKLLYEYGLISFYMNKKILSQLFLISEILESRELKYQQKFNDVEEDKYLIDDLQDSVDYSGEDDYEDAEYEKQSQIVDFLEKEVHTKQVNQKKVTDQKLKKSIQEAADEIDKHIDDDKQPKPKPKKKERSTKLLEFFISCREEFSSLLLHITILTCDVSIQNGLLKNQDAEFNFREFIFNQPSSFTYLSSITIKYLGQYIVIRDQVVTSPWQKEAMALLFNFMGDFDNDFFITSLDLVKNEQFEYYYQSLYSGKQFFNIDSKNIISITYDFIEKLQKEDRGWYSMLFEQYLDDLEYFFGKSKISIEFNLELTKSNFQYLLVTFLYYNDNQKHKKLFYRGLQILNQTLQQNYPGQSALFRGKTKDYFQSIIQQKKIDCMMMMKEIFQKDPFLIYMSPNVFLVNLITYRMFLFKLEQQLENEKDELKIKINIGTLFLYNFYFYSILEEHTVKIKSRKKFHLIISNELRKFFIKFVYPVFFKENEKYQHLHSKNFEFEGEFNNFNIKDIQKLKMYIKNADLEEFKYQYYFSFFKLFNKANYFEYSGKTIIDINKIEKFGENNQITGEHRENILIRLQMLKFFDRFQIFYNNHMLTERKHFLRNFKNIIGEHSVLIDNRLFFNRIFDEFKFLTSYLKRFKGFNQKVNKYVYKGLLAFLYKYIQGIRIHIYKAIDDPEIGQLEKLIKNFMGDMLEEGLEFDKNSLIKDILPKKRNRKFIKLYEFIQDLFQNTTIKNITLGANQKHQMKIALVYYLYTNLNMVEREIKNLVQILIKKDSKEIKTEQFFVVELQEDKEFNQGASFKNFTIMKQQLKIKMRKISQLIKEIYLNTEFEYIINRYYFKNEYKDTTYFMQKKLKFSQILRTKLDLLIINKGFKQQKKQTLLRQKLKPLRKLYKKIKQEINNGGESNDFLKTLISTKELNKNLQNILWYFIETIKNIDVNFEQDIYENQFFNNEFFLYLIIVIDNLMIWKKEIKIKFLEILNEKNINITNKKNIKPQDMFNKLLQIYYVLFKIVLYKTFQDDQWDEYWSKFFIISKFLQNLCDNNNSQFKQFLSGDSVGMLRQEGNNPGQCAKFSTFFEIYILTEVLTEETPVWLNREPFITIEDQPQLFVHLKRMIEHITEHLTGPYVDNQKKIYIYRPDMWFGIIERVIDDLDSTFYQVKLAMIQYYLAMLEGLNDQIVAFIASNTNVEKLFKIIIRLFKKLYIQQLKQDYNESNKNDKKFTKYNFNYNQPNSVSEEEENQIQIHSLHHLIHIYKFKDSFADHIILQIITNLYIFLKNLSFKIKFVDLFFKELDFLVRQNKKKDKKDQTIEEMNQIYIYQFLKSIIISIEIVYENNDKESFLQNVFFQKPKICYFLEKEEKKQFIRKWNIDSQKSKHLDLFSYIIPVKYEMTEQQKIYQYSPALYFFTTDVFYKQAHIFLYLLSIIINILLLLTIVFENEQDQDILPSPAKISRDNYEVIINIVGIIIIIFSTILTILWIITRYNTVRHVKQLKTKGNRAKLKKRELIYLNIVKALIFQPSFRAIYMHLLFSILGLTINYFYYTLNLLLVANLSVTLNYVTFSIVKHWEKFIIILMFTIILIFSYSFLMLRYFVTDLNDNEFNGDICNNLFACFVNCINFGLRLGGGISDPFFLQADPSGGNNYWGRFWTDISFFFLIKMVLLNMIGGIIIDAFNEMRDELNARKKDEENICPICGLDKWQIEKKKQDFHKHVHDKHNLWHYLYFMIRIENVDNNQFNGVEHHIYHKYKNDDTSWIPQKDFLGENSNFKRLRN